MYPYRLGPGPALETSAWRRSRGGRAPVPGHSFDAHPGWFQVGGASIELAGGGHRDESVGVRLLTLPIQEPLPGRVLPLMAEDHGPEEAARRYRAIVVTSLRQLRGLDHTRLRLLPDPADAAEAIRFWLLPRLADRWQSSATVFRADGWEIDFGDPAPASYPIVATADILCPFLCARWVHTALLGLERGAHRVSGPASGGGEYLRAAAAATAATVVLEERVLPELPVIRSHEHWLQALASPLGPYLRKAWEAEG